MGLGWRSIILKPCLNPLNLFRITTTMSTERRTRSDKKVGTIEKELGIQLYAPNGRKIRKDKTLGEVRKQQHVELTPDQKLAAKIQVKGHPKVKASEVNKIRKAVQTLQKK